MRNCPNCSELTKETYKFCPNCKITFSDFKAQENALETKANKFCTDCGTKIEQTHKFCAECGKSTNENKTENKIDNSLNKVKSGFSTISKELSESETVTNISNNAKKIAKETTEKAKYAGNKFLKFLGIVGFVILILMIVYPFITRNDFVIESAFDRNLGGTRRSYIGFFGEIAVPIILPLIFIYFGFRKNDKVIPLFWVLLLILIVTTIRIMN